MASIAVVAAFGADQESEASSPSLTAAGVAVSTHCRNEVGSYVGRSARTAAARTLPVESAADCFGTARHISEAVFP